MRKSVKFLIALAFVAALFSAGGQFSRTKLPDGSYACKAPNGITVKPTDQTGKQYTGSSQSLACNAISWWLGFTASPVAQALVVSLKPLINPDGTYDTAYPADGKPPAVSSLTIDTACVAAAFSGVGSLVTGTGTGAGGINIDSCRGGTNGSSGTWTENSASWSISSNKPVNTCGADGSGTVVLTLTYMGTTVIYPTIGAINWACVTPPGAGTKAPTIPTDLDVTPGNGTITITGDPPSDPCITSQSEGAKDIQLQKDGSGTLATVSVGSGLSNCLAFYNIGALSTPTPSATQQTNGVDWTIVSNGTLDGVTALAAFEGRAVSGTRTMTIKVTSVTAAADYGKFGLCNFGADPSVTANTRFVCFYAMNVGTDRYIELRVRGSDGASPSSPGGSILVTLPICLKLAYDGTINSPSYSQNCDNTYTSFSTASLASLGYAGMVGTSTTGSAGSTATGVMNEFSLNNLSRWTYTDTTSGTHTYAARSRDLAGTPNASSYGSTISGTANAASVSAKKWHPGHYMQVGRAFSESIGSCTSPPISTACFNEGTALRYSYYDAASFNGVTQIKGAAIDYAWVQLEDTQGDYTRGKALVDAEFAKLKAMGKRMRIRIFDEHYGANSTYFKVLPVYMNTLQCLAAYPSPPIVKPMYWNATCRARYLALLSAYSYLDADPMFEGITLIGETSVSNISLMTVLNGGGATGYTPAGFNAGLQAMVAAGLAAFPTSTVSLYLNYLDSGKSDTDTMMAYLYSVGAGVGAPDSSPTIPIWGYGAYKGTLTANSVNYTGAIPWWTGVEASELGTGAQPTYKTATIWTWLDLTMHSPNVAWDRQNYTTNCVYVKADGTSDGSDASCTLDHWGTVGGGGMLDYLIAHPTPTSSGCPTRYDTLFGDGSAGSGCNTN